MKPNEMPEKIYLFDYNDAMTVKLDGDVEYVRADVFIEKACEWLSRHFYDKEYEIRDDEGVWIDADCLIEDFEQYMKK